MDLYKKEWYEENSRVIESYRNVDIIDYGCPGKGIIKIIRLFSGIQISIQDMDTDTVFQSHSFDTDIISINYCIEGRQESVFSDHTVSYLPQNHLSVNGTKFLPKNFSFPLRIYRGISIVIEKKLLDQDTEKLLDLFGIDISQMEEKLGLGSKWFICHQSYEIDNIFNGMMRAVGDAAHPESEENIDVDTELLRLKVLELLMLMNRLVLGFDVEHTYFSVEQIEKTKGICKLMTESLYGGKNIDEYAKEAGISPATFYKVFMQIYGDTPHSYLVKYKMNLASMMLREGNKKISDIALELGYNNPSKFSKTFKEIYGVLPKKYQKLK